MLSFSQITSNDKPHRYMMQLDMSKGSTLFLVVREWFWPLFCGLPLGCRASFSFHSHAFNICIYSQLLQENMIHSNYYSEEYHKNVKY